MTVPSAGGLRPVTAGLACLALLLAACGGEPDAALPDPEPVEDGAVAAPEDDGTEPDDAPSPPPEEPDAADDDGDGDGDAEPVEELPPPELPDDPCGLVDQAAVAAFVGDPLELEVEIDEREADCTLVAVEDGPVPPFLRYLLRVGGDADDFEDRLQSTSGNRRLYWIDHDAYVTSEGGVDLAKGGFDLRIIGGGGAGAVDWPPFVLELAEELAAQLPSRPTDTGGPAATAGGGPPLVTTREPLGEPLSVDLRLDEDLVGELTVGRLYPAGSEPDPSFDVACQIPDHGWVLPLRLRVENVGTSTRGVRFRLGTGLADGSDRDRNPTPLLVEFAFTTPEGNPTGCPRSVRPDGFVGTSALLDYHQLSAASSVTQDVVMVISTGSGSPLVVDEAESLEQLVLRVCDLDDLATSSTSELVSQPSDDCLHMDVLRRLREAG